MELSSIATCGVCCPSPWHYATKDAPRTRYCSIHLPWKKRVRMIEASSQFDVL